LITSTDLDFVAPDDDTVSDVCETIDGATVAGFQFSPQSTRGDGRHWTTQVPVHRVYEITLPELPVIAQAEACAEKLARYRRVALGRDVYDLAQFGPGAMDEALVRPKTSKEIRSAINSAITSAVRGRVPSSGGVRSVMLGVFSPRVGADGQCRAVRRVRPLRCRTCSAGRWPILRVDRRAPRR